MVDEKIIQDFVSAVLEAYNKPEKVQITADALGEKLKYIDVAELTLEAYRATKDFGCAYRVGSAWEQIQKLEDTFDDDAWDLLELRLKRLGLIEEKATIYKHTFATWYEPDDWDLLDAVVEQKIKEYQQLLVAYVYEVVK